MTLNLENYRDESFVNFCEHELTEYTNFYQGVDTALIATPDGFEIASFSQIDYSADKLSAVSSSLFALGVSLVHEFNLNDCKSIMLDSDNGKVFISTIQSNGHSLILMLQTNKQAMLGSIIHGSKKLNSIIAGELAKIST